MIILICYFFGFLILHNLDIDTFDWSQEYFYYLE